MIPFHFTDARMVPDENEEFWLCLKVEDIITAHRFVATKKDKRYVAEIKEWRQKRSLDANAYCWLLIGKLAAKLSMPEAPVTPEQVYRREIRDVGDNYEVLCIKNKGLKRFKENWTSKGIGWLVDEIGPSRFKGFTNVRAFYGSSTYDRAQMHRLIQNIVQSCKEQGIETLTPEELARMTEEWK